MEDWKSVGLEVLRSFRKIARGLEVCGHASMEKKKNQKLRPCLHGEEESEVCGHASMEKKNQKLRPCLHGEQEESEGWT